MIEVRLVDHMGADLTVANAARQSFDTHHGEWSEVARTPRGRSDSDLVADLANDGHVLPFRHPHVTLACVAPLPVARQLGKHQVGLSWSETSRRYKTKGITHHLIFDWREAPAEARQGTGDSLPRHLQASLLALQQNNVRMAARDYEAALKLGATPEQARFLLPQSMDVAWTWTGSLLAFAHVCRMRRSPETQAETREFAHKVAEIMADLFPVAWAALMR